MKYWSQLEVERMLEFLYERQAARVAPEKRSACGPLEEITDLIVHLKEASFDTMSLELGVKRNPRRRGPSFIKCDEDCDGGKKDQTLGT